MWELKPEYRHYKEDAPAETKEDKNSSDSDQQILVCSPKYGSHFYKLVYILQCVYNTNSDDDPTDQLTTKFADLDLTVNIVTRLLAMFKCNLNK